MYELADYELDAVAAGANAGNAFGLANIAVAVDRIEVLNDSLNNNDVGIVVAANVLGGPVVVRNL